MKVLLCALGPGDNADTTALKTLCINCRVETGPFPTPHLILKVSPDLSSFSSTELVLYTIEILWEDCKISWKKHSDMVLGGVFYCGKITDSVPRA